MNNQITPAADLEGKDIAAIVLCFFVPGVGHMLLGQMLKGIAILAITVCTCGLGGLLLIVIALDAYCVARIMKERPVGDWEFFPEHKRLLGF